MKPFKWPLQKLLDVTGHRVNALRSELLMLSRQLAQVHQEIFRRKSQIRTALAELEAESFPQRVPKQEVFMASSQAAHKVIERLEAKASQLKDRRRELSARWTKIRKSEETLQRRHDEARQEHFRQQSKLEQKDLDEVAQVDFTRKLIKARAAD